MTALRARLFSLTPEAFWNGGRLVLGGALGFGLLLVVLFAWLESPLLYLLPLALLGGAGALFLFRHPLLNLGAVLAGWVLVADYSEGFQAAEVLYGLYYLAFLAHWFFTRLVLYRDRLFEEPEEKALLLFLVGITLSLPLTILFGGRPTGFLSEWLALIMLGFYFPVKEAIVRDRRAIVVVLLALVWIGLFISFRNFMMYRAALSNAEYAWQIAKGRVFMNDNILMTVSLLALLFLTFARGGKERLLRLLLFLAFFAGLILTQSRGYWLAFLFGTFWLFVLLNPAHRRRFLMLSVTGGLAFLAVGLVFFGDAVSLVLLGLFDRFASLGTATTQDLSLVNRFRETAAVWEHVVRNPVIGHGMGVPYTFYDLTYSGTRYDTFVHNGYVSIWYKFGLWGLGLLLFVWARTAWRGYQTFVRRLRTTPDAPSPDLRRTILAGFGAAVCLTAFTLSTITSNPFSLNDSTFILGLLLGMAGGAYGRARLVAS